MDWEGMPVSRGDVGYFTHDLASSDYSGRLIEGCTSSQLKLERKVPLDSAGTYITIVRPDGSFSTHAVQPGALTSNTLDLVTPLTFDPGADPDHVPYDYKWLYSLAALPTKKVKIESIKPTSYNSIELTALDETEAYYLSENGPFLYTPPSQVFGAPPVISNLTLTEEGVRQHLTGYLVKVIVTWDVTGTYSYSDVHASIDGGPHDQITGRTLTRSFEFIVSDGSWVDVEVHAHSGSGRLDTFSSASVARKIDFAGLHPPSEVRGFEIRDRTFYWKDTGQEVDVVGYRIKFHYGSNLSWGDAHVLHSGLLTNSPTAFPSLPQGVVSFMIVAVDAAGLESPTPSYLVVGLGDPDVANIVETIDFEALSWPGTLIGGTEVGSNLEAGGSTSFYNEDESVSMYGLENDPFYKQDLFTAMSYETEEFAIDVLFEGSLLTLDYVIEGQGLRIDYRDMGQGTFYGSDDDSFYSINGGDPFYDAPPNYSTWLGSLPASAGAFQFRISLAESYIQGVIDQFKILVDAPDMEEIVNDLVVTAPGTRPPLVKDFTVIKNIQITLEDDGGAAVSARWIDKQITPGPLVECIDADQVSVNGLVDLLVKGY